MSFRAISRPGDLSRDHFVGDLQNLLGRHGVNFGEPVALAMFADYLRMNDALRVALFQLCTAISHMSERDLTPEELLKLVARAVGGQQVANGEGKIPEEMRTAFLDGFERWTSDEPEVDEIAPFDMGADTPDPPLREALRAGATGNSRAHIHTLLQELESARQHAAAGTPDEGSASSLDSTLARLTVSSMELKMFLEDIELRMSRIEPHIEHINSVVHSSAAYLGKLERPKETELAAPATDAESRPDTSPIVVAKTETAAPPAGSLSSTAPPVTVTGTSVPTGAPALAGGISAAPMSTAPATPAPVWAATVTPGSVWAASPRALPLAPSAAPVAPLRPLPAATPASAVAASALLKGNRAPGEDARVRQLRTMVGVLAMLLLATMVFAGAFAYRTYRGGALLARSAQGGTAAGAFGASGFAAASPQPAALTGVKAARPGVGSSGFVRGTGAGAAAAIGPRGVPGAKGSQGDLAKPVSASQSDPRRRAEAAGVPVPVPIKMGEAAGQGLLLGAISAPASPGSGAIRPAALGPSPNGNAAPSKPQLPVFQSQTSGQAAQSVAAEGSAGRNAVAMPVVGQPAMPLVASSKSAGEAPGAPAGAGTAPLPDTRAAAQPSGPLYVPSTSMIKYAISMPKPAYPRTLGFVRDGTVVVQINIAQNGTVSDARVFSGPMELRPAAVQAIREWKFKPYLVNNRPVDVVTTINFEFSHR